MGCGNSQPAADPSPGGQGQRSGAGQKPRGPADEPWAQKLSAEDTVVLTAIVGRLQQFLEEYPYLEPGSTVKPHVLQHSVAKCRDACSARRFGEAQEHIRRIQAGLESDVKQVAEAFKRFDTDSSGFLDQEECMHMCAYLGWGQEEADHIMENADTNHDGKVSMEEFQALVGRAGGVQRLFDRRRQRINATRRDVCDHAGVAVGDRVRSHFWVQGEKSRSWREAQVLKVETEESAPNGMKLRGVLLEFGFGEAKNQRMSVGRPTQNAAVRKPAGPVALLRARQVVPPSWILSGVEDAAVVTALRELGIMDEQQAFWSLLYPDSEMRAVERLQACQRAALAHTRAHCVHSHDAALPKVRERFAKLGYTEFDLQAVLTWVQDLAPVVIHVGLDHMGQFLEIDEFYRNQFETKTSQGALDPENKTRKEWEHELFGGTYDQAKPFDRCKYGALNILNDYRGVVSAQQYGDSYLVLKDVRLRCTFASTDSGGIEGSRLAVLDKYAHVLEEYEDDEINCIVGIATAATSANTQVPALAPHPSSPQLLRGPSEDPTMTWVTMGMPELKESKGRLYFEVELQKGVCAPQVGLLSQHFRREPRAPSGQGVGDDEHGWALDGANAALWHSGVTRPWKMAWKVEYPTRHFWYGSGSSSGQEELAEPVTVGLAIDLDQRRVWFTSDGKWDEKPDFDSRSFPKGGNLALYPAISLKGRAAFNFGPDFKYQLPKLGGSTLFTMWPGASSGLVRVDSPIIGNEEMLSIYKEVQIHGEVSLKSHVQRLVACNKYRDHPKTQRSAALKVVGAGRCSGTYKRVGAHKGFPLYQNEVGAKIFAEPPAKQWRLSEDGDVNHWRFTAPFEPTHDRPPRTGWDLPDRDRGVLDTDVFGAALEKNGIGAAVASQLSSALTVKESSGVAKVYKAIGGKSTSLVKEWQKLNLGTPEKAKAVWKAAVKEMQQKFLREAGVTLGEVVETEHPYPAKRHTWKRAFELEGAANVSVLFSNQCCTLDSRTSLKVFSSGLRREVAGPGARVEVTVPGGDKVWGTVTELSTEGAGLWRVRLDRHPEEAGPTSGSIDASSDPAAAPPAEAAGAEAAAWPKVGDVVEGRYKTGVWHKATIAEVREDGTYLLDWYDGLNRDREKKKDKLRPLTRGATDGGAATKVDDERYLEALPRYGAVPESATDECWANCAEKPQAVTVKYDADAWQSPDFEVGEVPSVGKEITSFKLDRTHPLRPITVVGFEGEGPAQRKGVQAGWYLDIVATFSGWSGDQLSGILNGIGGVGVSDRPAEPQELLDACFAHPLDLQDRLNQRLRTTGNISLVFTNSSSPSPVQLLPEAWITYGGTQKAGDEIQELTVDSAKKVVTVKALERTGGPAHVAGVRAEWEVDVPQTVKLSAGGAALSEEQILADPKVLLAATGTTVVFRQPQPAPVLKFQFSGPRVGSTPETKGTAPDPDAHGDLSEEGKTQWRSCVVPGNHVELEFSSDGDTANKSPAERWGIWALVMPKEAATSLSQAAVDQLATKWVDGTVLAEGCEDDVEIQRNDWDEARLRALCARHGWEFSWMTEDGERRRRATEKFDTSMSTWTPSAVRPMARDVATPDGSVEVPVESKPAPKGTSGTKPKAAR